jgi:hypothetical protein
MATSALPLPTATKTDKAINILSLIAALLPVAEALIHSYVKSDKTKDKVSMVTGTAAQIIPIVTGVLAANKAN